MLSLAVMRVECTRVLDVSEKRKVKKEKILIRKKKKKEKKKKKTNHTKTPHARNKRKIK